MGDKCCKHTTKDKILDATEKLFAEKGLDGASMRDITEAAGVNLASVNYHFGSKDGLMAAVFQRRLAPLMKARLELLEAAEAAAGDSPPSIEAVMEAFIRPAVEDASTRGYKNESFLRLMGRCLSEPIAYIDKHVHPHFEPFIERFQAAIARAEPDLTHDDVFWKTCFVFGVLHHGLHMLSRLNCITFGPDEPPGVEEFVQQLISFTAAGIKSR
ncbi:MAG: TetR/AcrR family transcriptional regulator [Syntrophobacteraceae bacterium]